MPKKTHRIELSIPVSVLVLVEAEDEDEAYEKAKEQFSGLSIEWNHNSAFVTDDNCHVIYASDDPDAWELQEVAEATPEDIKYYEYEPEEEFELDEEDEE